MLPFSYSVLYHYIYIEIISGLFMLFKGCYGFLKIPMTQCTVCITVALANGLFYGRNNLIILWLFLDI